MYSVSQARRRHEVNSVSGQFTVHGVRLSRPLLSKYSIENRVIAEQRPDGILLRGANPSKATLEKTFTEMAAAQEQWDDLDAANADGLDKLVW